MEVNVKPESYKSRSKLADPEIAEQVAAMFANGASNLAVADVFDVSGQTAGNWRRDIRVRSRMHKYAQDRIASITKTVDKEIAERLGDPERLTVKELLDIRKEFLGGALRAEGEATDESTVTSAMEAVEKNPEKIEELLAALAQQRVDTPADPVEAAALDAEMGIER